MWLRDEVLSFCLRNEGPFMWLEGDIPSLLQLGGRSIISVAFGEFCEAEHPNIPPYMGLQKSQLAVLGL